MCCLPLQSIAQPCLSARRMYCLMSLFCTRSHLTHRPSLGAELAQPFTFHQEMSSPCLTSPLQLGRRPCGTGLWLSPHVAFHDEVWDPTRLQEGCPRTCADREQCRCDPLISE